MSITFPFFASIRFSIIDCLLFSISTEGRCYHGKFASVTSAHDLHQYVCPRFTASAAYAEKMFAGVYEISHFCAIPSMTK